MHPDRRGQQRVQQVQCVSRDSGGSLAVGVSACRSDQMPNSESCDVYDNVEWEVPEVSTEGGAGLEE